MAGAITVNGVYHVFQGCPDGPGSDSWNNHPDNHDTAGWHHGKKTVCCSARRASLAHLGFLAAKFLVRMALL
jgi:hypothetical protein